MPLADKSILMKLGLPSFSFSRIDRQITQDILTQHNADQKSGRFVKTLLPAEVTKPITKILDAAYEYHRHVTLPWADDGTRLLPTAKYMDYMDKMREFMAQLDHAARQFDDRYDVHIHEARTRLGLMFKEDDFPSKDEVRVKLKIKLEPVPVPSGDDFRVSVDPAEMEIMRASVANRIKDAEAAARADLYRRVGEPLAKIVNRLSDPEATFRDSLLRNLEEITDLIPALNITNDPGLDALRTQIKSDLAVYTPAHLRESPACRNDAVEKANAILSRMNDYMN